MQFVVEQVKCYAIINLDNALYDCCDEFSSITFVLTNFLLLHNVRAISYFWLYAADLDIF